MSSKVLVADDSGVMRKIIVRALNSVGIDDVTQAGDGVEALEKFNGGQFDRRLFRITQVRMVMNASKEAGIARDGIAKRHAFVQCADKNRLPTSAAQSRNGHTFRIGILVLQEDI